MRSLRGTVLAVVAFLMMATGSGSHGVGAASDDGVRLVVILASGWNSSGDEDGWNQTWKSIRTELEKLNSGSVVIRPFSYVVNGTDYQKCDTNQPIADSATVLTTQGAKLLSEYPNAGLVVVGHSLGGAIATYWLGELVPKLPAGSPTAQRLRNATVVTIDSPVAGLDWAALDDGAFKGTFSKALEALWCESSTPVDLNPDSATVTAMAKAPASVNYYNVA